MPLVKPFGEIHCPHCHRWFRSPIPLGTPQAFLSSTLIGTVVDCSRCGQRTGCNKTNVRWRTTHEGFVGTRLSLVHTVQAPLATSRYPARPWGASGKSPRREL